MIDAQPDPKFDEMDEEMGLKRALKLFFLASLK